MMFADLADWIQQVLRDLSREGYIYIGRTGAGLSHAFRKGPDDQAFSCTSSFRRSGEGPLTECMKQGTIRAIEQTAQYQELGYRLLLEQIAILGPKWVSYEEIQKLMEQEPILRALREAV